MNFRIDPSPWFHSALLSVVFAFMSIAFPTYAQSQDAERTPATADEFYQRGAARKDQRDYQGAYQDLSEAIRLEPKHYKAYSKRCAVLYNSGLYSRAMSDCQRSLAINSLYFRALYNRGMIRKSTGDLNGAMQDFNQAIKINPKYGFAYLGRGYLLEAKGDIRGALSSYTAAIEKSDSEVCKVCTYQSRANLRFKTHDFTGAEPDYTYLLERDSDNASNLVSRGICRFQTGKSMVGRGDLLKAADLFKQAGDEMRYTKVMELLKQLEMYGKDQPVAQVSRLPGSPLSS